MSERPRLRIMHLIGSARPGGAETFAVRLLAALNRHPEIDLLVVARKNSWVAKRLQQEGIRLKTAAFGGFMDSAWLGLFGLGTAGKIEAWASAFAPAVIQSWMNRATRFVPAGPWETVGRLGGFYNLRYYFNKVNYLIGNTQEICNYCMREGWPARKVAMISNFIPDPAKGWRKHRPNQRKAWKIPDRAYVLLAAGRLHPVKGLDVLLEAMAKLPDDVYLLLAGEGPERAALEEMVETLGLGRRVRFIGWLDQVSDAAAAADLWVAPSRHEPLGNTVLDAWAHEIPVIASRTGGMAMLIHHGKNGLLVPVEDSDALAEAIYILKKNRGYAKDLAAAGLERFEEDFSEKIIVEQYVAYYRKLAGMVSPAVFELARLRKNQPHAADHPDDMPEEGADPADGGFSGVSGNEAANEVASAVADESGAKSGAKPGVKSGVKPGVEPGAKPGKKSGTKSGGRAAGKAASSSANKS